MIRSQISLKSNAKKSKRLSVKNIEVKSRKPNGKKSKTLKVKRIKSQIQKVIKRNINCIRLNTTK